MKIYDFTKIISEIGKGAEIDISSLNKILSSKARLKQLRKTEIQSESIASLLRSLAHVNLAKLILTVVLMVVQLGLTIASPFLTNYLIDNYLKYPDSLLLGLILIFAGYKVAKFTISIICNYCYQSLGFEFFARLYWYVLANYRSISGRVYLK
jgi:ABC-type multidrug transport system fused ATPase/permease subunit